MEKIARPVAPVASSLAVTIAILMVSAGAVGAGETLYNGIVLPDQWPPRIAELTREPMPVPYLEQRPDVVPIDVGRQLFVDDFLIEQTTLKRTYHTARYHPACPVLRPDRPWEDAGKGATAMVFSDGVWYDPRDHLFKMWYMAPYLQSTCYAVSSDGIRWEKPSLDVVPGTNIVLNTAYRDSSTVWLDLYEQDRTRRYKMTLYEKGPQGRLAVRFSPDGIHWGDIATWAGPCGDRTTVFYNPFRKVWVYSIRGSARVGDSREARVRHYREGADLVTAAHWNAGEQALWVGADRLDPRRPGLDIQPQLYNLDAVAYESLMLGLFSIWQGPSNEACKAQGIHKRNEVLLGFSRDGFHWHRPDRRPFIGVDETPGSWAEGNVQSAGGGCLIVGDKLFFYFSGRARCGGKHWDSCGSTGLAILRRDGFASMDAVDTSGTLTTRPLTFKGKYFFVNADARGGELRVEVLDRDGNVIPPFSKYFCMPVTTDGTIQPVQWMESRDLAAVAGKPVRFRFHLTNGKLYSFWVSPDASGASQGYVAAGGPGFTEPRDTVGAAAYRAAAAIPTSPSAASQAACPASQPGQILDSWVCVTPHAAFSPRDTAENFVFAGKMWLSNGWRHGNILSRDLWCSTDGADWTLVSDSTPYDPYSEMVVYDGKVWAIKSSVWNSADGVHWNKVLDKTPFGDRGYGETVVFKDKVWQLGSGQDVWSTTDGANWTCATPEAAYGDRSATAVAAFDGKLWVMAGRRAGANTPPEKGYKDITTLNDVWCSADGANWRRVLEHAPWAPREWGIAAAYAGRLWLIGGHDNVNSRNLGDVWTTTDGQNWQEFRSPTRFAPRHEVTPYVFDGSLWVVAGNTWPVVNDAWSLTLPPSTATNPP